MSDPEPLTKKRCIPCEGGVPHLQGKELQALMQELGHDWELIDERKLQKEFRFSNFREALNYTIAVGELAEEENHHPDVLLSWGKVQLVIWTHKINGLTESDFILAAKCEEIYHKKGVDIQHPTM